MIKNINYLVLFVVLSFGFEGYSQKAVLDTNQIEIGDQIYLKIQVEIETGKTIRFPEYEDYLIPDIEILENFIDTINTGKTLQQNLLISSFEDSTFHIAPIEILIDKDTVRTNPLILRVGLNIDSALISKIDTSQLIKIHDIKKPIQTPWTFKEFWQEYGNLISIVLFVLLLATIVIYYIIRKRKNKPIFKVPKPKIPAHITALKQLDKLKEKKLWQKGKTKQYYTRLTYIVRNYIEKRFDIPALEYITSQTLTAFETSKSIDNEAIEKLKQILYVADFVKFAKNEPLAHENDLSMKNAYSFVNTTKKEKEILQIDNSIIN